ncbi:hypothetical protein QE152_g22691 [Popillia japonica]|uniref:Uncharacterized protein n=1 Tax=Popillia japonica TaxID=7064 RepID=A0AAW1KJZ2_POPJA
MVAFRKIDVGACEFPREWTGGWFQSGVPNPLHINATFIETKGECYQEQGEKVVVYDKADNCYRCMAIHVKHPSVLQYKETDCVRVSPQEICTGISGDAPLYSMFRKYPEAKPIPCPFKSAPFTFSYNRGTGDCSSPVSKAESCTDDSRLVLKYQACPDVHATESNVEELICVATWKEGSTRYLVGRITQGNRRPLTSDEDQYRCFIYQRDIEASKVVYNIAQSADATCNGLQSAFEGSKTLKFKTVDNHHNRCKFPTWITDHHTWLSLDHKKTFKFSQRNATLKIVDEEPKPPIKTHENYVWNSEFGMESQEQRKQNSEMRVICHGILQQSTEQKKVQMVQIVAHMTHGCNSGYVCMVFYKRDNKVIEIQQSEHYQENPDEACRYFDATTVPFTTLITTTLKPKKCPHLGRYTLAINNIQSEKRRKRQQPAVLDQIPAVTPPECESHDYESLSVGCTSSQEQMEFKTPCVDHPTVGYSCHGSWYENNTYYVITTPIARRSTDNIRYCMVYSLTSLNQGLSGDVGISPVRNGGPHLLRLSGVLGNCNRDIIPGIKGNWAFNFTSDGSCDETNTINSASNYLITSASVFTLALTAFVVILR